MNVKGRRKKKLIRLKASKNTILFLAVAFCGILLDLLTKWIVFANFKDTGRHVIIKGFLGIVCSENEGVVFGFAQGRNNVLIFFCLAAIGVILWFYKNFDKSGLLPSIAFGMILSGAIGNLWDRIFHHHVRDFIDVHLGMGYHWPTFNIADSLICVGVGLVFYETLFTKKRGSMFTQKTVL